MIRSWILVVSLYLFLKVCLLHVLITLKMICFDDIEWIEIVIHDVYTQFIYFFDRISILITIYFAFLFINIIFFLYSLDLKIKINEAIAMHGRFFFLLKCKTWLLLSLGRLGCYNWGIMDFLWMLQYFDKTTLLDIL
jgi:hypothetical protein